jgi:hypothetical protein
MQKHAMQGLMHKRNGSGLQEAKLWTEYSTGSDMYQEMYLDEACGSAPMDNA